MSLSAEFFKLLGDPVRLRIFRLLAREKLNVSELTDIFGGAQSGISRHLQLLRKANMIREDRDRGWTYYFVDPIQFDDSLADLWPALKEQLKSLQGAREDDARLKEVLRQRKEDFREEPAATVPTPGRSWAAWARTLSYLAPKVVVADLGCGDGHLTLEVARWARRVYAIDKSKTMLNKAKALARKHDVKNIQWRRARIEKLPLKSGRVDVVLMALVLHSLQDPVQGLLEARRILKPGGILLVQELRSHQEEWVKTKLGDVWLGFEERGLREMMLIADFDRIRLDIGSRRRGDPFTVLIGSARKGKREKHHFKGSAE